MLPATLDGALADRRAAIPGGAISPLEWQGDQAPAQGFSVKILNIGKLILASFIVDIANLQQFPRAAVPFFIAMLEAF
jgi:hypothetical protein